MKKKNKMAIEIVSFSLLEREFHSKRIYEGLVKTVSKSLVKGREAGFQITKELFSERIMYPRSIIFGDRNSIDLIRIEKAAREKYTQETGSEVKRPFDFDFQKYCEIHELKETPYPEVDEEFRFTYNFPQDSCYNFLCFHTHLGEPDFCYPEVLVPSGHNGDLDSLENKILPFFDADEKRVLLRPIHAVIYASEYGGIFPFLLYQKKDYHPLRIKDFETSRNEALEFIKFHSSPLINRINKRGPRTTFHNFALGFIDTSTEKLKFSTGFNLKNFAYESPQMSLEDWKTYLGKMKNYNN